MGVTIATVGAGVPRGVGVCKEMSGLLYSCDESLVRRVVGEVSGGTPGREIRIGNDGVVGIQEVVKEVANLSKQVNSEG